MNKQNNEARQWYCYGPDDVYLNGAAYLGISSRQLKRLVDMGKIGCSRPGGLRTLFSKEQLDEYIASCTVAPTR